jgi:hypothetical protein
MAQALRKGAASTKKYMKHNTLSAEGFESTYALLVRSEDKERSRFEGVAYLVFILSAVFSIWQMVQQPVTLPTSPVLHTTSVAHSTDTNHRA